MGNSGADSERHHLEDVGGIASQVRARSAQAPPELEQFLQALFGQAFARDLDSSSLDELAGGALALWHFVQEREPGKAKVRVYEPTLSADGWSCAHTVIEIVNDDMPFLVDSISAALSRRGAEICQLLHPIIPVVRDGHGGLVRLALDPEGKRVEGKGAVESMMHIQIRKPPIAHLDEIERELVDVLADVRLAVEDWRPMRQRCHEIVAQLAAGDGTALAQQVADDTEEVVEFLRWLDDDHFTYLGYREYVFEGSGESAIARIVDERGLGLLRAREFAVYEGLRHLGQLPPEVREFVREPRLLRITKATTKSRIHRPVPLDTVAVKTFDAQGRVNGERVFVGLFTAAAYSLSPAEIPILRRKVAAAVETCGFPRGSHNAKVLRHVLDSFPRDELFLMSQAQLESTALGILELHERPRVALFARLDPFERSVSFLVFVPRERFDTRLRTRIQELLAEAYHGDVSDYYTFLTDNPLARLHVIIQTTPGRVPRVDIGELETRLVDLGISWSARLESALVERLGRVRGLDVASRFYDAFPVGYQEDFQIADAVLDTLCILRVEADGDLVLRLYDAEVAESEVKATGLKIFTAGSLPPLSDILPTLERMGVGVLQERAHRVTPSQQATGFWVRELMLVPEGDQVIDSGRQSELQALFRAVGSGRVENDGFNRLVLLGGFSVREATLFRAYARYLAQLNVPFSARTVQRVLAQHAAWLRELLELFELRFDPDHEHPEERVKRSDELAARLLRELDAVADPDEDRILRRCLNLVSATVRTNAFQKLDAAADSAARLTLAFKLDSSKLQDLPRPRPWRELWVYHPEVEGIHLRSGPVARGGLRFSDRREDFRTEILGLMKAQRVKNAVIVPEGSKGGFVVRRLPPEREAARACVERAYRIFVAGLLCLTDNRVAGKVVPPERVVRWDGDDPYLVVAADKGTATFSDVANSIASQRGFWLDDAFASGGSAGYDHKRMAITARGAWESVRRHFRELGQDVQRDRLTVVGVGDMSGDVFGNGMLLSRSLCLLGAFNHQHIFLDPNPDPERSFAERQRLFQLPSSSWGDYDPSLISDGGGVFSRSAKWIEVAPSVAAALHVEPGEYRPADLIRCLLRAPVDLLWFGGIGTYVKASAEGHESVGDRANDGLRIDGHEVRARVIGEGANLGITQRGRIECVFGGVRLNADFIDNSGGVDCSDHEVNLKILLRGAETAGRLERAERDELLRDVEDEVAQLVLRSNYLQPQSISVSEQFGVSIADRLARVMRDLERRGVLDRRGELLPSDDQLEERRRRGAGFTRPELALLLSYAKLDLRRALVTSDRLEDPALDHFLVDYFPKRVAERFREDIHRHPLRREIVATGLANEIINRCGPQSVFEIAERTDRAVVEVALAFAAAREILDLPSLWQQVESLDGQLPTESQYQLLADCGRLAERAMVWILTRAMEVDVGALVMLYAEPLSQLMCEVLRPERGWQLAERERSAARMTSKGVPGPLAARMAALHRLTSLFDIVQLAGSSGVVVGVVAELYYAIGARLGFDWFRNAANSMARRGPWDRSALSALIEESFTDQATLVATALESGDLGSVEEEGSAGQSKALVNAEEKLARWLDQHQHRSVTRRNEQLFSEMRAGHIDLGLLTIASRALSELVERVDPRLAWRTRRRDSGDVRR